MSLENPTMSTDPTKPEGERDFGAELEEGVRDAMTEGLGGASAESLAENLRRATGGQDPEEEKPYDFENDPTLRFAKQGDVVFVKQNTGEADRKPWTVMGVDAKSGTVVVERDGETKQVLNSKQYLAKDLNDRMVDEFHASAIEGMKESGHHPTEEEIEAMKKKSNDQQAA